MFQATFTTDEGKNIRQEFQRLDKNIYLDHAGATLYSEKQMVDICSALNQKLIINPHSSRATEDMIEEVRARLLKHFNVDSKDYSVIFTSGATAALKVIAECFQFGDNGKFVYVQENHTSVLGMREIVKTNHIHSISRDQLMDNMDYHEDLQSGNSKIMSNNLLAFSAQCNFSGFKYPLQLINSVHKHGLKMFADSKDSGDWYVCLDAASFVSTNLLDLNKYKADFVVKSFYKMFGYPSGLGALLVNSRGQDVLKKKYFGGGTVKIAMSRVNFHEKKEIFHESFEDGTIPFLAISSLFYGFQTIERLIPAKGNLSSFARISQHTYRLGKYCYEKLKGLKYSNGESVIRLYCLTDFESQLQQGGVVTFNVLDWKGNAIGYAEVACIANAYNIHLRTGCFCNPGACQFFLGLSDEELLAHYKAGHVCGDYTDLIGGIPTGAVRVSFGYMSRKEDVDALINMISECYLKNRRELSVLQGMANVPYLSHVSKRIHDLNVQVRLKYVCIYPIKSCGAYKIYDDWTLTPKGLKYDRCWMIITSSGKVLTQKSEPRLCLLSPIVNLRSKILELQYPGMDKIEISLDPMEESNSCCTKLFGDVVESQDCGDAVANWISDCFNIAGLRLVHHTQQNHRRTKSGQVKDVNLSNQAQFLLINETSVSWLLSKVEDGMEEHGYTLSSFVDRFRGNFIIETSKPFDENCLKTLCIGANEFTSKGPCSRCQVICIDQQTGRKTLEPLRTIAAEFGGKVSFGIYLSHNCQDDIVISPSDTILVTNHINSQ